VTLRVETSEVAVSVQVLTCKVDFPIFSEMVTVNMAETVMQFIAQRLLAGAGRFKALEIAFSFHCLITV
jgi:hypothetical protein